MEKHQAPAARKTAHRVPADQSWTRIAFNRSHWFHSARPQALLIAAVERMPKLADRVTAMGLVKSCDHIAPVLVLLQRAMSGWFVISVAVLPMPELMEYMKNQPQPLDVTAAVWFSLWRPILPLVETMQKMNNPQIAGNIMMALAQKNFLS